MRRRLEKILIAAFVVSSGAVCFAQPGASTVATDAAEQQEADYRVMAARCGTPAYEKFFYRQSKAAVVAGLVPGRDPALVEKSIESRRRNPSVLVPNRAACDERIAQLKEIEKQRVGVLGHRKR